MTIEVEKVLRHPARPRILLALHAEGPLSPTELSKKRIGRGFRAQEYDFHIKQLAKWGLVEAIDRAPGDASGVPYMVTERLTQPLLHEAALKAIREVVRSIPTELAQWLEQPYIEEISEYIEACGLFEHPEES